MTTPHEIDFEADAAPKEATGLEGLGLISKLGEEYLLLETEIERLENEVKANKARLTAIAEKELPDLFFSLNMSGFELTNKKKIKVEDFVRGSIPKDRAVEACGWLRDHGHGGLVKRVVAVAFGAGEDEKAEKLKAFLTEKAKLVVVDEQTVHHSTLASWAREMKKKGEPFPADLLGLFIGRKATIK